MKTKNLRSENNCLNCGNIVEVRFCSHCGQENLILDLPFYFAFLSYFQTKAKYDKNLIKSTKTLIKEPGFLTKEYTKGRRASHLEPVRFYIAVSFIVFFVTSFLYSQHHTQSFRFYYEPEDDMQILTEDVVSKMDQNTLQEHPNVYFLYHPFYEKLLSLKKEGWSDDLISEKLLSKFVNNIPTALFLYLPVFALVLWIFSDRKNYTYFINSIFSIHYFTLLIISFFVWYLLESLQIISKIDFIDQVIMFLQYGIIIFVIFHFVIAYQKFFDEKSIIGVITAVGLLSFNLLFFSVLLISLLYYTFITME